MGKKTFLIDVDKCSGCDLCVIACKDEHVANAYTPWTKPQPSTGHFWINVQPIERGRIPRVRMSYLPLLCQHCANAACMKSCPDNAIKRRDDGLVWIDPGACTGCRLCEDACPYDVIYMNAELGIAQKCTGCAHRVDEGLLPRCAEICPHEAIGFSDETKIVTGKAERAAPAEIYHPEYQAQPRVYWKGLPRPWIAGAVIDSDSGEVIPDAAVTAADLFDDGSVTLQTDEFGDFWIERVGKDRKYKVEIAKQGYVAYRAIVTTDGDQDLGTVRLKKTSGK